jgi:hypothetical protein
MNPPPLTKIALALLVTLLEQPFWLATFLLLWLWSFVCTVLALVIALLTGGRWTFRPTDETWGEILHVPRRFCIGPDPKS